MTPAIMVQGTGSDVGKSLIVAGLCRVFVRRGLAVRPFKPQNMSNNAAVTADGGEIGRAQALQARACRVPLSVHMNPVLLKPETDVGAQVIVQGRRVGTFKARAFQGEKPKLMAPVLESFAHLCAQADLVVVEGAGSASEINLRSHDIANMGFAEAADVPVILVGDIDRGGVIAAIVGTQVLLPPAEAARIKGFVINRFRGDPRLFDTALVDIAARTGWPALGVVPFLPDAASLPAEDAVVLERPQAAGEGTLRIAVPVLSRIANHDDFDPLRLEPGVDLVMVRPGEVLPANADLVILPGSKSTIGDLRFLRAQGWDIDLLAHWRRGGRVLGICGGYQMLGRTIADPDGIEGPPETVQGLGLLDVETVMGGTKTLVEVTGRHRVSGTMVRGYEMHMGRTTGADTARPLLDLSAGPDGAISADGRVAGTYVHGLFAGDAFRAAQLQALGRAARAVQDYEAVVDAALDCLADHLERHLDCDAILAFARARGA
ncbi:cobyric acid synthase [Zavarzinia sp. CC-PAN008]|uniref:cobyric acid synthase n=1 Tax=Zavarzinia sp. CC-PAN008 TaxID=3243332 RepID=UPI003F74A19B